MEKNNKKTNIIVATITFVIIISFAGYFIKTSSDRETREELESVVRNKETAYNDYIEEIKDIVNSEKKSDRAELARISGEVLYEIDDEYYQKTKKGDEHLDKLKVEATKNLNEALSALLSNNIVPDKIFELISSFANNPKYVNDENIALYNRVEEDYYKNKRQMEREAIMSKSPIGLSESEVKLIAGYPDDIFKSTEAEFWTYGDVVLTMKNGYVYDITSSLE